MSPRRQLCGPDELEAGLERGDAIRLVLVESGCSEQRVRGLAERAAAAGITVRDASPASLWRLSLQDPPARVLALVGADPGASLDEALAERGAAWLLAGTAYPGNTGFAIRTAEVSGADAIFIDNDFEHEGKREATRAAMRADRFMPVFWRSGAEVLDGARRHGRRIFAVEDVGTALPWEVDLTGPVLFVIGGERHGIPGPLLEGADQILRLPMQGFIPSYNLQAAMAAVALERIRQLGG